MKKIYFIIALSILLLSLQDVKPVFSADEPFYAAPKVRPNVLIILDRSGSMARDVGGGTATLGCPTPAYPNPLVTNGDYSRICIARQVLFDLLDANDDNTIDNTNDPTSLDVRLGYSRFIDVSDAPATDAGEGAPTAYYYGSIRVIYDVNTDYTTLFPSSATTNGNTMNDLSRDGYTPLGTALSEALSYFTNAPAATTNDNCISCRKNNVILVTDGADTVTCTAGDEDIANRRATVWAARELRKGRDGEAGTDDDINVFVVGFGGDLPENLQYTLNWAAYYGFGGNDPNSSAGNTDTGSFTPGTQLCDSETGAANDPGAQVKLGYAFLADNAASLASSLQSIIATIRQGSYSRSAPVLTTAGIGGANKIYAGFFDLGANVNWQGHLLAWNLDATGNLIDSGIDDPCTSSGTNALRELYDAGRTMTYYTDANCTGVAPNTRKVYTAVGSPTLSQIWFNVSAGSNAYDNTSMSNSAVQQIDLCAALNISGFNCNANYADPDTSAANNNPNELINFIRFSSATFNGSGGARNNNWHLGDIWHSTPTIIGPPLGVINSSAYRTFKNTYANRTQILIVGANDGMLHALDDTKKGSEMWSFIPNNLLGKLKNLSTGHSFFVDASPTAADVCLQANCGTLIEAATDWKTVLISGERDGGKAYFALDITDTTNPSYLWEFQDACLGNTWSKPTIGKVRYSTGSNTVDKWVTFFGGGVSSSAITANCDGGGNSSGGNIGNYVYAVDIASGDLLGTGPNATKKQVNSTNTSNNVPSALRPVDLSGDYYIDAVYFGDASGRMHRWDVSNLGNNNNGSLTGFFDPGAPHYYIDSTGNTVEDSPHTRRPIYYRPSIALDRNFRPVIVFGTGNIDELAAVTPDTTTTDYVYAIRQEADYAGNEADQSGVTEMWKITLNPGERLAGATMLYGGYVLFTTYRPPTTNTCTENGNVVSCDPGSGWLYIVDFETGAILAGYPQELGQGLPAMTCSGDKCYTITSNNQDIKVKEMPSKYPPTAETIYWRER